MNRYAQWIGRPGATLVNWQHDVLPAPMFRREFTAARAVRTARVRICGLGYYELRLNGEKVGDHVLDPIVTHYDRRVRYVTYDLTGRITPGANTLGVVLGNGWYNCHTSELWHFDKASWRDYPKLWLELQIERQRGAHEVIVSDTDWKVGDGPIRFDGLRNGEVYDAREERPGWDRAGYDDADWEHAVIVPPPGGLLEEQTSPPCKVMDTLVPQSVNALRPGVAVYDLGQNMAGWAQLRVEGCARGTEIVLRYGERLKDNGDVDQSGIGLFIKSGDVQTDRYIAKGGGETWEPRFVYHGFRYVRVEGLPGTPTLESIRGRVVRTAFAESGSFACSSKDVNALQRLTQWSYVGNFVGIPTDCPHREKNGWTGDAQLAAETGLLNYDTAGAYAQWLDTMADAQRPSGQFPGIVPSCGWGYNWGSGPAWDAAFILIPWYIYLYTGNSGPMRKHYDGMRRYLDFCAGMATDHLLSFGLGDWCPVNTDHTPPATLTSTAYYHVFAATLAGIARITGHDRDVGVYDQLAQDIRDAFNREFYRGGGVYDRGQMTAQGCALYQGLVPDTERAAVVKTLVDALAANNAKVDFGILGAKYVPRALAEHGHAELAYRLITQPEFPGWVHWLRQGLTTLRERWDDTHSGNHIMFGDVSAWFYHYLAGIRPDPACPGFKHIILSPRPVADLRWVHATHRCPYGLIEIEWDRQDAAVHYRLDIPAGTSASFMPPGRPPRILDAGRHDIPPPPETSP
ncbi:MAG: family 78 glycoside hydrolase catalytic domain [Lentisphaerae bacterium]|nr:family 78 glycoside hydrolase catalytic domain [Lentisphaerota bacterium]